MAARRPDRGPHRRYRGWRGGGRVRGERAARYLTGDAQFHAGTVGDFTGRAAVAGVLAGIVAAIPDLHADVQDIFGHGDEVVVRLVVTGTQDGPLLGIPATGRHLQYKAPWIP